MSARTRKGPSVRRLDGARHWRKIVDALVRLLLLAGVKPAQIRQAVNDSVRRYEDTKPLDVPPVSTLEYSRILTHWSKDPAYCTIDGEPAALPLLGERSFQTLVAAAVPGANVLHALGILKRHQLIRIDADKRIHLLSKLFVMKGAERAQALGYVLSAAEGIFDTFTSNLTTRQLANRMGRLQRTVIAERFDLADLPEYDRFVRKEVAEFLERHDAWLKAREHHGKVRQVLAYVGMGIFGFRAK